MTGKAAQAIVAAFVQRFLADRECGEVRSLRAYQAPYPGYEDAIAHEFDVLTGTEPSTDISGPAEGPRYEDRGVLGRGGMGEVRRVFDRQIRREVARKTLRSDSAGFADNPRNVMRFLEEAQIAGQLEHPGIIPVHDLGVGDDERPFFTMSLVRGREFGEIIDRVHDQRDGWTMTRALDVLLRVCDAVAFAHSQGVAHRDLKPANVLVGEFGRTHVVDWGLARVLQRLPDGDGVTSIREALRDGGDTSAVLTLRGDLIGTASYMSPEQAAGDIDRVGFASDAYALGAILYQLLTGRPPYCGEQSSTSSEVLARLRDGPPPSIFSIRADAPPELVAVCEKAMARSPDGRFASVNDFADDLRAFLDLRVVRAYQSGPLAELRKWIVRNRAFAAACAAAALALVAGLVMTAIEKHRADAAALRADANFRTAFDAIGELSNAGWSGLVNVPGQGPERRRVLERALTFYEQFVGQRGDDPVVREQLAEAQRRLGILRCSLGQREGGIRALESAARIYEQLVTVSPSLAVLSGSARVSADLGTIAGREGRTRDARKLLGYAIVEFDAIIEQEPDELEHRRRRADALAEIANVEVNEGELERAFDPRGKAVSEWRRVASSSEDCRDVLGYAEALWNLGYTEMKAKRPEAALVALTSAREKLEEVLRRRPGFRAARATLAYTLNGLGQLHAGRGEHELSTSLTYACVGIRRDLVRDYPNDAALRSELAGNLHNLGMQRQRAEQMDAALALFQEARREQEAALARGSTSASARRYLSYHLNALCQVLLALRRHHQAIEVAEALGPNPLGGVPQRMAPSYAARCIPIATADAALSESERAVIVEDYARRSTALVVAVIESGWQELAVFRKQPFLELRGRPDFDAVVPR